MLTLSNSDFLSLWEQGQPMHPLDRALLAIRLSLSREEAAEFNASVADWPLGRKNRALARLRTLYFGPLLEGWTVCPECGEQLEFKLDCRNFESTPQPARDEHVSFGSKTFRLPTSRDLASIANQTDSNNAVLSLLRACTIASDDARSSGSYSALSVNEIDDIANRMADADPLAEISVGFDCPICHHASEEVLDLSDFLWTEIESRARRLLSEVHLLALAYGWAESDILSLSDSRRTAYLQMVQS
ncbi:MAG TPA: hypothetical protein VGI45_28185 [Terracidiphilus sp.]|jgi:hypothetical protein